MILSSKDITRYWCKVDVRKPNECWPWLAGKTKFGHGVFSIKRKWIGAHRVSFLIANGYLPDIKKGRLVMHDCENPICQNPKHLIDGTVKENGNYPGHVAKQRNKIGSWAGKYAENNTARWGKRHSDESKMKMSKSAASRKLEEYEVLKIIKSDRSSNDLARQFGVSSRLVRLIKQRKRWSHLPV